MKLAGALVKKCGSCGSDFTLAFSETEATLVVHPKTEAVPAGEGT
jgi:hypothetical protein